MTGDPVGHRLLIAVERAALVTAHELGYGYEHVRLSYKAGELPRIEIEFRPTDNRPYEG